MTQVLITLLALTLMFFVGNRTPLAALSALIGFVVWFGLYRRAKSTNRGISSQSAAALASIGMSTTQSEGWLRPLGRILAACLVALLIGALVNGAAPGILIDWPGQASEFNSDLEKELLDRDYDDALKLIRERLKSSLNEDERNKLEAEEVEILTEWGQSLKDVGYDADAYRLWNEARDLADRHGLETQFSALNRLLAPTPTPEPTHTPAPTYTPPPPPTPVPTFTPQPTYTPAPTSDGSTGYVSCDTGSEPAETLTPSGHPDELLKLWPCSNRAGYYNIEWFPNKDPETPVVTIQVQEGGKAAVFFRGTSPFRVTVEDGAMVIR